MKKIFPIITVLILLSLLGLIFFQVLWIQSAWDSRNKQIEENFVQAVANAGSILTQEKNLLLQPPQKTDLLFPGDRLQMQYFRPSVIKRFSRDEIAEVVRNSLNKFNLQHFPFEFNVRVNAINGEQVYSDNFFKYYADSSNSLSIVYPLEPPSGSNFENLVREELLYVIVPHQQRLVWKEMIWFILGAIFFTFIITAAFFITIRTLLKQKKLSEIKSDFINNMTHEFKTPIATISLAADTIANSRVITDEERARHFVSMIKKENQRMNRQVETILQIATLDKHEMDFAFAPTDMHEVISQAIDTIEIQVTDRGGVIHRNLNAEISVVTGDAEHLRNLVHNLLDNANKYSEGAPDITVSTRSNDSGIFLDVADRGIGMSKSVQYRVFERFYRETTGNIHTVKGFGLGLNYVKAIADAHGGTVTVESEPGKGSIFTVFLPFRNESRA